MRYGRTHDFFGAVPVVVSAAVAPVFEVPEQLRKFANVSYVVVPCVIAGRGGSQIRIGQECSGQRVATVIVVQAGPLEIQQCIVNRSTRRAGGFRNA